MQIYRPRTSESDLSKSTPRNRTDYLKEAVSSGRKVGNRWLRDTARALAGAQCSPAQLAGMCQFSERWLANFKKRYAIAPGTAAAASVESGRDSPNTTSSTTSEVSATSTAPSLPKPLPVPAAFWLEALGAAQVHASPPKAQGHYEPGRRGRKVQFPQVEAALHERALVHQAAGGRLSNRWLQAEAKAIAGRLCPDAAGEAAKAARCSFSEHWLANFKRRYGLSLKAKAETASPAPSPPAPPQPDQPSLLLQQWQAWLLQSAQLASTGPALPKDAAPGLNLHEWYTRFMISMARRPKDRCMS